MIAYIENPHRRQKDLIDLKSLLQIYEMSSDRIFGQDVFAAGLEDIEYAGPFLLGIDLGALADVDDTPCVHSFLSRRLSEEEPAVWDGDDLRQRDAVRFHRQLQAFEKGFGSARKDRLRRTAQ
jgi:predicted nucleotidyltransferase